MYERIIQLEALGRLRRVPRRRPHLSLQRGRRMGRARHRHRLGQLDVRRLGRRRARGGPWFPRRSKTCELNDADPPAWLAPVRAKPRDRPAKRRDGRHGIGRRASRQSRKRLEPRRHRPSENTRGGDRMDPTDSSIANRTMLESPNAGAPLQSRPIQGCNFCPPAEGAASSNASPKESPNCRSR